ncbi:MAG: division/cell wall cluster transcriptional repressor MraZ [Anaerolineae bacterium]|nr:division/cell wall cluster transcriptional repressor MraZ [Anaerolineae bacterium]
MFLGQYAYTLDSKGRLTIPARFREEPTERLVITRGLDHCLALYPLDVWQELAHKVNELPITSAQGRALRRLFFADAADVSLDSQGRILVPERLREYAALILSHEVVIVGLDRYLELWSPSQWEMQNEQQLEMMKENPALWENLKI